MKKNANTSPQEASSRAATALTTPRHLNDFESSLARVSPAKRTPTLSRTLSITCVTRLYKDAVRRMGYTKRLAEEKARPQRGTSPVKTVAVALTRCPSAVGSPASRATLLRSKSLCQIGNTTAKTPSRREPAKILQSKLRSSHGSGLAEIIMKKRLRMKQQENAKELTSHMETLEQICDMNPGRQLPAELLAQARRSVRSGSRPAAAKTSVAIVPQTECCRRSIKELNRRAMMGMTRGKAKTCRNSLSSSRELRILTKTQATRTDLDTVRVDVM